MKVYTGENCKMNVGKIFMSNNLKRKVESQASAIITPMVAGLAGLAGAALEPALGTATSELVGQAIESKAGQAVSKPSDPAAGDPGFAKDSVDYLQKIETGHKNLQLILENFHVNPAQVDSVINVFKNANIPYNQIIVSLNQVLGALNRDMAGSDPAGFLNNYSNILLAFLRANPEQPAVATQKVVEIANFEQTHPYFTGLGYQPSKLAMKKLNGEDINDDLNSMKMIAFSSGDPNELSKVSSEINQFSQILGLGEQRDDQWGVQKHFQILQENQMAKEMAYQQHAKTVMQTANAYDAIQSKMTSALTVFGLPSAWATITSVPTAMIAFVRNMGQTIGAGGAPIVASPFTEELNLRLAYGNHDYVYAQTIVTPPSAPTSGTPAPVGGTIPTSPSAATTTPVDTTNVTQDFTLSVPTIQSLLKSIEANEKLVDTYAPSVSDPIPMNLANMDQSQVISIVNNALKVVNQAKPMAINELSKIKSVDKSNEQTKSLYSNISQNFIVQILDYEAKLESIKVAYPLAMQLFKINQGIQAEKFKANFLGFKGTVLELPAINTQRLIRLYMEGKALYESAASQYAGLSGSDQLEAISEACRTQATEMLSNAAELMQRYDMGGMSLGASVRAIEKLERYAESDGSSFEQMTVDNSESNLNDLIKYSENSKSKDEIFNYYDELLPGYGKTYEEVSREA